MSQVPQHAGNQQQGLGAPQGQNPYYAPNVALNQVNGRITGENEMKMAQAAQAGAQAGKAQTEAAMLQQMQGLVPEQPAYSPEEVQAGQLSEAIVAGQLGRDQLTSMIQAGEVSQGVADAAANMAQQTIIQRTQEQGLGAF